MPKVSVVMSVYNCERFLGEAIESILNQTFKDFEFIIINDGSTDSSGEIIKSYKDTRIVFLEQENKGLTASLNRGIEIAKGEYIARMDADDISHLERLDKQVRFLDENLEYALVGTWVQEIDEYGKLIKLWKMGGTDKEIKQVLPRYNCFVHGSTMFKKKCFEMGGGYRASMRQFTEDYDLWLRISERFKVANIGEILYYLRNISTSIRGMYRVEILQDAQKSREFAFQRYLNGVDIDGFKIEITRNGNKDEINCFVLTLRCWAWHALREGKFEIAKRLTRKALFLKPQDLRCWYSFGKFLLR